MTHDFYANIDKSKCIGCGICEKRCQLDAIYINNKIASIDLTRCLGCGLCVSTCKQNAINLIPVKQPKEIHESTDSFFEDLYKNKKGFLKTLIMALRIKIGKQWRT